MAYRAVILGLATFLEQPQGRLLLLPDGRNAPPSIDPERRIEPHRGVIYVHRNKVVNSANWWNSTEDGVMASNHVREFPIGLPSTITLSGMEADAQAGDPFDENEFRDRVVRLRQNNVDIQLDQAATIARIPIRRGRLVSRLLRRAVVAQLEMATPMNAVTITATPTDPNAAPRTLTLAEGTEFIIANVGRNLGAHSTNPLASHFRLYAQLDAQRRVANLVAPTFQQIQPLNIPFLNSRHPYIQLIVNFGLVPETQCSVTGCCG